MKTAVIRPRKRDAVRSPKVVERRSRVYAELLDASAQLFASRGVDAVTVGEIIAVVGISRRTFYGFFANKYEIIAALLNPVFESGSKQLCALQHEDVAAVIPGIVQLYLQQWSEHRRALEIISVLNEAAFPYIEAGHRSFGAALKAALTACEAAGLLRNDSAEDSFRVISRTAVPLLKIYRERPDLARIYSETMNALLAREPE